MTRVGTMLCALALSILALAGSATVPRAQDAPSGTGFLNPFPPGDVYKLAVVGDSFAEGALAGLAETFASDSRLQIAPKRIAVPGLARAEIDDEIKAVEDATGREPSQILVVMVGREDRAQIRLAGGKRLGLGGDEWREEYARRLDRMMKAARKRGAAVYWLGLPVVQRNDWNETIQLINDLIRDRANANGVKYIDTYTGFSDESGSFLLLGPDAAGLVRLLRESDGVGFTAAGNRKLAHFVEREIRRDLTQAKTERSIPLAGSEVEQSKINPAKAAPQTQPPTAQGAKPADAGASWTASSVPAPAAAPKPVSEQKADNSRIALRTVGADGREETANVDILRPAIPTSVVELMARNSQPGKATQLGDTLVETLPGGLQLLSSVMPAGDLSAAGRRGAKLAPTQTPYFRVMVKGEQLPSKPGRADDFRWPRPDQIPEPVVAAPQPAAAVPAAGVAAPAAKNAPARAKAQQPARP